VLDDRAPTGAVGPGAMNEDNICLAGRNRPGRFLPD
jgi:hypothetical protein